MNIYGFTVKAQDGSEVSLADYKDKVLLVVNTATGCGFTPQYDVVFVGFPIWWGREPSVVDTFLTSYGFKEKYVVPFCTSGGSEIGDAARRIAELTGAKVNEGMRFGGSVAEEELKLWLKGLDL